VEPKSRPLPALRLNASIAAPLPSQCHIANPKPTEKETQDFRRDAKLSVRAMSFLKAPGKKHCPSSEKADIIA
jgi:hypothetical protein